MADSSADRDPLDRLAEEFVARFRAGERPALSEYAARLPGREEEVRDLFPALVEMEQLKPVTADQTGGYTPGVALNDPVQLGDFRILRRVGQGGMGVVYEAMQESLGRHVALKLLPAEALLDPRKLERFRREAKSAAKLHHTNIVPVFGTGQADGRHFYAMQFISGHPLDAVIDEVKRLKGKPSSDSAQVASPERAVSVMAEALVTGTFAVAPDSESSLTVTHGGLASGSPPAAPSEASAVSSPSFSGSGSSYWSTVARLGGQVADALAYAHKQGVQHRDIKPANLLLDLRGTVWVTDFGLAKSADAEDLTNTGDILGTLRYMAPERFEGQGDERADIYALGLTLYELLTLTPAFAAENRAKLVEQVLAASPPRPRSINPAIPRDLETIVLKAVARDPAARYQTASDLHDDLQRYLEGRTISARRASTVERVWRAVKRNPAVAVLSLLAVLLMTIGTAVSLSFAYQADGERRNAIAEAKRADDARADADARSSEIARQQAETRWLLYASRMNLASAAANEYRFPRLRQLLEEAKPKGGEPDLRGWEWHYLNRVANPPSTAVTLDTAAVMRMPEISNYRLDFFGGYQGFSANRNMIMLSLSPKGNENLGKMRLAVFDSLSGNFLRLIQPPTDPRNVPWILPIDPQYHYALEARDPLPLRHGVVGPPQPRLGYRISVTDLTSGERVTPVIDLPLLPNHAEPSIHRSVKASFASDRLAIVWQSQSSVVAYTWHRKTGSVEMRVLAKDLERLTPYFQVPCILNREATTAVLFRPTSPPQEIRDNTPISCTVEIHDLTTPLAAPTVLDTVTLSFVALNSLYGSNGCFHTSLVPILEGETGRVVRLLDTRNKKWIGRWTIPARIPLSWDTQTNSIAVLHTCDNGQRILVNDGNGNVIIGERMDSAEMTTPPGQPTEAMWRTAVFPRGQFLPKWWLSPDGNRIHMLQSRIIGKESSWQIREWAINSLPGHGRSWPEQLDIEGVICSIDRRHQTGDWDLYFSEISSGLRVDQPVEFRMAIRNRVTGQLAGKLRLKPGDGIPLARSCELIGLSADARRAVVQFTQTSTIQGRFTSKFESQLLALDQPDRPVLRTFPTTNGEAPFSVKVGGRSILVPLPEGDAAKAADNNPSENRPQPPFRYRVCSLETGEPVGMLPADPNAWKGLMICGAVFTPDNERLIVSCCKNDGAKEVDKVVTLRAYDLATGREAWNWECPRPGRIDSHELDWARPARFSPDGKMFAFRLASGIDNIVWLLDSSTGQLVRELQAAPDDHTSGSESHLSFSIAAFGPNGVLALGGYAGGVSAILWNGPSPKGTHLRRGNLTIFDGIFSPDGKRLFTYDRESGVHTIRVWDTATARELLTIREPTRHARGVDWTFFETKLNLRFEGDKLLMDTHGGELVLDGTPETP